MKRQNIEERIFFLSMVAVLIFGACSALPSFYKPTATASPIPNIPTPTAFQTPDIPNWGSTPSNPRFTNNMPDTLNCALVPQPTPAPGGVIWRGLQVGVSTYEDVKNTLDAARDSYSWSEAGNLYFGADSLSWQGAICFTKGGTLAAIQIIANDLYKPLSDVLTQYGNPDRVTWAHFYDFRSLLWAEKGLLMVASEDASEVMALYMFLFSPVPRCQLEQSWIYQSLPKKGQIYTGDVVQTIRNVEDPWKIEKGLADCSKK